MRTVCGLFFWEIRSLCVVSFSAIIVVLFSAPASMAAVIQHIEIHGANRISTEFVRSNLMIVPGKVFSDTEIDGSVKQLYALGQFTDVAIRVSGNALIVELKESKLVNQVVFNGNRKIKDGKLQMLVRSQPASGYSDAQLAADVQAIKDAYSKIGQNRVEVVPQIVPLDDQHVNVAFVINEGDRSKIVAINFIGNQAFDAARLKSVISTKKSNFLSFLTRKDVYDRDRLRADEEALGQFYFSRGYADFRVISSNAELTNDSYTLTFTIEEGRRYRFGGVTIGSDVQGIDAPNLRTLLKSREGEIYNADKVQQSIDAVSDYIEATGNPFAKVTTRGSRNLDRGTIDVAYIVSQGTRAYVERIDIRGNTRTRDYIIRREIDVSEGDALNQHLLKKMKRRLDALGFFKSVNVSTAPGHAEDRVIVIIDVEEDSTGSFGIGAGMGSDDGVVLEASVEEKNFLGRGQYIRLAASGGWDGDERSYSLAFTEPYFLGNRIAVGFDVNYSEDSYDEYDYNETGFTLRASAPITEDLTTTFRYNFKRMDYDNGSGDLSATYNNLIENGPWIRSSVSNTLTYTTLDEMKLPRSGVYATLTQELAGLGGDSHYYKISGKARYYDLLLEDADVIGSISVGAGHIVPFGDSLNIYDQFMLGGSEVRGFANKGIGARIADSDDQPLGGTTYFTASVEATFPLPGVPRDAGFRGGAFLDAGTLFGNKVDVLGSDVVEGNSASVRASVGLSLIWDSPFGALRLDYAIPITKQDSDDVQEFKFGINNQF